MINLGMSWTTWILILFAAYKVPPMLPDLLGYNNNINMIKGECSIRSSFKIKSLLNFEL